MQPIRLGGTISQHRTAYTQVVHGNLTHLTGFVPRKVDRPVFEELDQVVRHVRGTLAPLLLGSVVKVIAFDLDDPARASRIGILFRSPFDFRKTRLFARLKVFQVGLL